MYYPLSHNLLLEPIAMLVDSSSLLRAIQISYQGIRLSLSHNLLLESIAMLVESSYLLRANQISYQGIRLS